jgi:hypothetical protein
MIPKTSAKAGYDSDTLIVGRNSAFGQRVKPNTPAGDFNAKAQRRKDAARHAATQNSPRRTRRARRKGGSDSSFQYFVSFVVKNFARNAYFFGFALQRSNWHCRSRSLNGGHWSGTIPAFFLCVSAALQLCV